METVVCPECDSTSSFEAMSRSADHFCPVCDFPLFWVGGPLEAEPGDGEADDHVRRLPGVLGRGARAGVPCPACRERNIPAALVCVRCGAPLVSEPEPEPEDEVRAVDVPAPDPPAPEERERLPWLVIGVLAGCLLILLVLLLTRL